MYYDDSLLSDTLLRFTYCARAFKENLGEYERIDPCSRTSSPTGLDITFFFFVCVCMFLFAIQEGCRGYWEIRGALVIETYMVK